MDEEERQHLEKLLRSYRRRLRALEIRVAQDGPRTPPEVLTEVEDLRSEIAQIETRLGRSSDHPPATVIERANSRAKQQDSEQNQRQQSQKIDDADSTYPKESEPETSEPNQRRTAAPSWRWTLLPGFPLLLLLVGLLLSCGVRDYIAASFALVVPVASSTTPTVPLPTTRPLATVNPTSVVASTTEPSVAPTLPPTNTTVPSTVVPASAVSVPTSAPTEIPIVTATPETVTPIPAVPTDAPPPVESPSPVIVEASAISVEVTGLGLVWPEGVSGQESDYEFTINIGDNKLDKRFQFESGQQTYSVPARLSWFSSLLNLHHTDANTVALDADTVALVEVTGQRRCWHPDDVSATPTPNRPIEISCLNRDAAGQDGAVRAGVPFPNPRFTVNGELNQDGDCSDQGETCDGTMTDNLTGLIWLRDTDCLDNRTWAEALDLANNLEDVADKTKDCGLNDKSRKGDWRLPNVKELQSLIDFGYSDPALSNAAGTSQCTDNDCAFQDMGSGRTFWSSTTFIESDPNKPQVNKAWAVDVGNAKTLPHFRWEAGNIPTRFFVLPVKGTVSGIGPARVEATGQKDCWNPRIESNMPQEISCTDSDAVGQDGAVRAGVPFPSPRFTVNGDLNGDGDCTDNSEMCDGTVTDKLTGLIWLKNANCFSTKTWAEALDLANNLEDLPDNTKDCGLNDNSHKGDWRLPNVKELQSLVDFDKRTLPEVALPVGHPFQDVRPRFYWSSTTVASEWDAFSCTCTDEPSPGEPDDAWAVSFTEGIAVPTGNIRACEFVIKNELRGVWLVRGGIMDSRYQSYLPLLRK